MRRRIKELYRDVKYEVLRLPRLEVRPTDGFIASWPRGGNTWMRYLVCNALWPETTWDLPTIVPRVPNIDRADITRFLPALDELPLRVLKTHDKFRPYFLEGKVAYLIRNGRDAITSHYHFRVHRKGLQASFSEYVERSLKGRYRHGSWQEHVRGWWEQRDNPNLLIIRYEDMLKDTAGALDKVLRHFGHPLPAERLEQAVERSRVEHVNRGFQKASATHGRNFSGGLGGGSGKGKQAFGEREEALLQQYGGSMMRELGYT